MLNIYSLSYLTLNQANIIAFLSEPSLIGSNDSSSNSSCNCRNTVATIIFSISIFCFAVISIFCIAIISLFCFTVISIFCFVTLQSKGTIHGHG